MKIVILAAMEKELSLIETLLTDSIKKTIASVEVVSGKIGSHDVTLAKCGIGKVNSALMTYRIVNALTPDLVINTGVAGGAGIPVGSVLIADSVAYDDVWCGPGTSFGEADGCPQFFTPCKKIINLATESIIDENVKYGLICSGDKFITTPEEISFIKSHFQDVMAVDMESASIAQTCYLTNTPFNIIRVVSDTPGEGENLSQYLNFWTEAPQKTFSIVRKIIEKL